MNRYRHSTKRATGLAAALLPALAAGLLLLRAVQPAQSAEPQAPSGSLAVLYTFTGVTDDGAQSAAGRKEATSILCTNLAASNTTVEVHVFNWDGSEVGTGTATVAPNNSYTFSTQNTTIYFEDVILGSGGGTPAIFQGFGEVWTDQTNVICTAEILDPLGYPPVYMDKLPLFTADGYPVGDNLFSDGFDNGDTSRWSSTVP